MHYFEVSFFLNCGRIRWLQAVSTSSSCMRPPLPLGLVNGLSQRVDDRYWALAGSMARAAAQPKLTSGGVGGSQLLIGWQLNRAHDMGITNWQVPTWPQLVGLSTMWYITKRAKWPRLRLLSTNFRIMGPSTTFLLV